MKIPTLSLPQAPVNGSPPGSSLPHCNVFPPPNLSKSVSLAIPTSLMVKSMRRRSPCRIPVPWLYLDSLPRIPKPWRHRHLSRPPTSQVGVFSRQPYCFTSDSCIILRAEHSPLTPDPIQARAVSLQLLCFSFRACLPSGPRVTL